MAVATTTTVFSPLVKKVLKDILKAQKDGYYYNAAAPNHLAGRFARIQDDTTEAKIVCDALAAGISVGKTTVLLNAALLTAGREPVSCSAVQRFKRESPYLRTRDGSIVERRRSFLTPSEGFGRSHPPRLESWRTAGPSGSASNAS